VIFCHSLESDWNHGNAHFLRGIASELVARGFDLRVWEPEGGWSASNLVADHGKAALSTWRDAYPTLASRRYDPETLDLEEALDGAALVLVHEWNPPELVARIGAHRRARGNYLLLFHDTHHRMVSDPDAMRMFDLSGFDGVLAFGEILREAYLRAGWARTAFTWHEAADLARFQPPAGPRRTLRDLVWVGNWGDEERTAELHEFLLEPVRALSLQARVHGVRYPLAGREALADAGIWFAGYLPNFRVPKAFAEARVTVHVPRRPYMRLLPGIPTIRVFEALACGIPLVTAPWDDVEGLFAPGEDFLVAQDGSKMRRHLRTILSEPDAAAAMAAKGLAAVRARHSCAHRVDELLGICRTLGRDLVQPQLAEV
jgi:spore maturation protein CgeB